MRLIDADALRAEYQAILDRGDMFCEYDIIGMLDKAPTVEPFEPDYVGAERLEARQRGYEEGYHNGMRIGKTLNPKLKQGEWIDTNEAYIVNEDGKRIPNSGISECSVCKQRVSLLFMGTRNFCPNCGADMRKEEES